MIRNETLLGALFCPTNPCLCSLHPFMVPDIHVYGPGIWSFLTMHHLMPNTVHKSLNNVFRAPNYIVWQAWDDKVEDRTRCTRARREIFGANFVRRCRIWLPTWLSLDAMVKHSCGDMLWVKIRTTLNMILFRVLMNLLLLLSNPRASAASLIASRQLPVWPAELIF